MVTILTFQVLLAQKPEGLSKQPRLAHIIFDDSKCTLNQIILLLLLEESGFGPARPLFCLSPARPDPSMILNRVLD